MRQLRRAVEFPEENRAALDGLRSRYRMALLSNFDHGPTVEAALRGFDIHDRFDVIVVSADVGWRKPHPEIFHETLRRMGIGPDQAIFVGDTPEADVLGPQGVGMDAIWINRNNASLPPGAAPPTHTVTSLRRSHKRSLDTHRRACIFGVVVVPLSPRRGNRQPGEEARHGTDTSMAGGVGCDRVRPDDGPRNGRRAG
ncbi:MAG: HAD family hydrolase [Anaerotruncus sp.]|nr:HAD family hydrolase [Anaerotruncus sp.]